MLQTLYNRSDYQTVNGFYGYQYQGTGSNSAAYMLLDAGAGNTHWKSDIYIRHANGSETTLATNVADVTRSGSGEGMQTATWNCPETILVPTDALRIHEKITPDAGTDLKNVDFISSQLGWTKLNAATWTFYKYTRILVHQLPVPPYAILFARYLAFGDSTFTTRIEGIDFTVSNFDGISLAGD